MSFTKNLKFKKLQIFFLKFVIVRSLIETTLKQFIVNFSNRNFIILGAFLLPFTFYTNFLEDSKYKKILSVIEQNIPGTVLASNQVSWETFQKTHYLPLSSSQYEDVTLHKYFPKPTFLDQQFFQNVIHTIDYWGDFLTLEFKNKWKSYQKNYFFGFQPNTTNLKIKKPLLFAARDNFSSKFYSCILANNSKQIQKNFYDLDEFPLKLQNIQFEEHENFLNFPQNLNSIDTVESTKNFSIPIQAFHFNEVAKIQNSIIGIQNVQLAHRPTETHLSSNINSSILQKTTQFYLNLGELENQFKSLFYKSGCFLPNVLLQKNQTLSASLPNLLGAKLLSTSSGQILTLLENYDNLEQKALSQSVAVNPNALLPARKMSGFNYPDMTSNELTEFNQQNNYGIALPKFQLFNGTDVAHKIKIYLGSHFYYPVEYSDSKPQSTVLKLKYYPAKFEGLDGTINYSGPVILTKPNQSSSNYQAYNWFKVRNNLHSIFDPTDPRQKPNAMFFGSAVFDSTISRLNQDLKFNEAQNNLFDKNVAKRKDLSGERENFIHSAHYKDEYVVPYFNSKEWHMWLLNTTNNGAEKTPYIQSFPIRQISSLVNTQFSQLFDLIDYQNPSKVFGSLFRGDQTEPKIIFYEHPFAQSAISSDLTRKNYTNVTYLKRINQYKFVINDTNPIKNSIQNLYNSIQLNSFAKREMWEPIHANSWLVVSQYAFAIFVLYLLRQFAVSYGRELVSYLIDLFSSLGIFDASFKDELISENSRYRIIKNPKTRFQNIAGIEQIFSQLSEVVWFLRNSKRFLDNGQKLPKGILLVGPPGTGKTLLVQAIAGEAQIPIFLQPAGAFNNSESLGAQRLQKLFEKAKELSPCIIFFDEIDSIGQRRSHIIQNPAGNDSLFAIVSNAVGNNQQQLMSLAIPFASGHLSSQKDTGGQGELISTPPQQQNPDQLSLLMQLLIELDGLQSTKKVIVIGATNRVDVLDPALIRPGRFDKVLQLGLPKKLKRIQICQLYAQILGINSKIYWEYIGNKTFGLSGADLATIMNQSSIDAILNGTKHTMQTIELAINKITGDSTESHLNAQLTSFIYNENQAEETQSLIPRLAYYHAGFTITKLLLPQFTTPISCSLFPKHENTRYKKVANDFLTAQLQISRRNELKAQILALYSGKACELLYFKKGLNTPNSHFLHSDFANEDLSKATNLIYQLVDKWHLYSHSFLCEKLLNFPKTQNSVELLDSNTEEFLSTLAENVEVQTPPIELTRYYNFQNWAGKSWWQIQVTKEESSTNVLYSNWYRIYLKNPDETMDNDEWVVPDRYYHNNETFFLTKTNHFNDFHYNKRDILYQTLLKSVVHETFDLFYQSTEFIDFFTAFLIKNQYLRRFEIDYLYAQFFKD